MMLSLTLVSALAFSAPAFDRGRESIATEIDQLTPQDSGRSVQVLLRSHVDWDVFSSVATGPASFDLDPKFYRRRFDPRVRQWVDESVESSDQKHLAKVLNRELERRFENQNAALGELLYIEPVITMVMWSYAGKAMSRRPLLSADSVQAGSSAVRFNLRRGGPDGELVGSILDRWQTTLRDQIPRNANWIDAERGFHFMVDRLDQRLRSLGALTPNRNQTEQAG